MLQSNELEAQARDLPLLYCCKKAIVVDPP
jgi:hypothetical protein